MSSETQSSIEKRGRKRRERYEHHDYVFFPFKEEWQKPDTTGNRVERDEVLRKKWVPTKKRNKEDLVRYRMFRALPRTLGISPEDYNMFIHDRAFKHNKEFTDFYNKNKSELALGGNWRKDYDPELHMLDLNDELSE